MRTLDVEEDIYTYLLSKTQQIGESASSILRRELKLHGQTEPKKGSALLQDHELSALLSSPKMRFSSTTEKFLTVLGDAYRQKPNEFEKVLVIQGRGRRYFARSENEIINSGSSTHPKQIPDSPFWVMTNSPTHQKKWMLRRALQLLSYSETAVAEAEKAI